MVCNIKQVISNQIMRLMSNISIRDKFIFGCKQTSTHGKLKNLSLPATNPEEAGKDSKGWLKSSFGYNPMELNSKIVQSICVMIWNMVNRNWVLIMISVLYLGFRSRLMSRILYTIFHTNEMGISQTYILNFKVHLGTIKE